MSHRLLSERTVEIVTRDAHLQGTLRVPHRARGLIVSTVTGEVGDVGPRLARALHESGFATLEVPLLSPEEVKLDTFTGNLSADLKLQVSRMVDVTRYLRRIGETRSLAVGFAASGPGAAAALYAAAQMPDQVRALVSLQGRLDLARSMLHLVRTPTLLISDTHDGDRLALHRESFYRLRNTRSLQTVPQQAWHFAEPVIASCLRWFESHLVQDLAAAG